jgi:NAD(P)H dehydrogenase (quinone)
VYQADRLKEAGFDLLATELRERMRNLDTIAPIPFRSQNGGDYLISSGTLLDSLEQEGAVGFTLHRKSLQQHHDIALKLHVGQEKL